MQRGLGISKGFDKSRRNGWFISVAQSDGRRPKQYFDSGKLRDEAFTKKVREVRTIGADAAAVLTTTDRQSIQEMIRLAADTGLTPMEIFQRGLAQVTGSVSAPGMTVGAAISAFLVDQDTRLSDKKISKVRHKEIRNLLGRFQATGGKRPLAQCNRTVIKAYLTSLEVGAQTRVNHARNLRFFFAWCVNEDLILKHPVPAQEGVTRIPQIFTNKEVGELFGCAREHHPALLPMLGVQWYAGLRPGASHHLRWEDVDFSRCRILIQPHGNKLRQPDIVKDLPLAVFAFLAPLRQANGPISPPGHVKQNYDLHKRLGYGAAGKRWPEDVARHTFASNLYAHYGEDSKRVEAVMLHATSAMLQKHYLLKNVPVADAAEYFSRYLPST